MVILSFDDRPAQWLPAGSVRNVAPDAILIGPFEMIPVAPGGCLVISAVATRVTFTPIVERPDERIKNVPPGSVDTLVV
jgi:hypothetical protein